MNLMYFSVEYFLTPYLSMKAYTTGGLSGMSSFQLYTQVQEKSNRDARAWREVKCGMREVNGEMYTNLSEKTKENIEMIVAELKDEEEQSDPEGSLVKQESSEATADIKKWEDDVDD